MARPVRRKTTSMPMNAQSCRFSVRDELGARVQADLVDVGVLGEEQRTDLVEGQLSRLDPRSVSPGVAIPSAMIGSA